MNRKAYLLILITLILMPIAVASISESMEDALDLVFDATGELAYIKVVLWILLFFAVFQSVQLVYPRSSSGLGIAVALAISILGIRFMPEEYTSALGKIILIISPFIIANFAGSLAGFKRKGRIFVTLLFYGVLALFLMMRGEGLSLRGDLEGGLLGFTDIAMEWLGEHKMMALVFVGLLMLIFLWGTRGKGRTTIMQQQLQPGSARPGFFSGLRGGATRVGGWFGRRGVEQAAVAGRKMEAIRRMMNIKRIARGRGRRWPR